MSLMHWLCHVMVCLLVMMLTFRYICQRSPIEDMDLDTELLL